MTSWASTGGGLRSRFRRFVSAGWRQSAVTIDQLVFSAVTFALQLVIAPNSTASEFGVFSLVAIVQIGLWYVGRGLASEPLLVSRAVGKGDTAQVRGAAATAFCLGLVASAACVIASLAFAGPARYLLLIQALATPFTAVLDHSRYVNYALQRPKRALLLDSAWLGTFLAGSGIWMAVADLGVLSGYLVWALAAIPVAVLAAAKTGHPFSLIKMPGWLVEQRKLIPGFVIDAAYLAAGTSAAFGLTAWLVGVDELGLLRKALVPVTLLIVLFIGIGTAMLAQLAGRSPTEVVRAPALVTAAAAVVCALFAILLPLAPAGVMTAVLGSPWSKLQGLVLALLLYAFVQVAGQMAMIAVKASGRAWVGPLVRTVQFLSELGLVAGLGISLGISGVVIGMISSWFLAVIIAWVGLLSYSRRAETQESMEHLSSASD